MIVHEINEPVAAIASSGKVTSCWTAAEPPGSRASNSQLRPRCGDLRQTQQRHGRIAIEGASRPVPTCR